MSIRKRVEYKEGDVYEGEWTTQGKRQGIGRLKMASGNVYSGEFVNGFFHGLGVLTLVNGSKYEGCFEIGKYQGHGIYSMPDRTKFEVIAYELLKGCAYNSTCTSSNNEQLLSYT